MCIVLGLIGRNNENAFSFACVFWLSLNEFHFIFFWLTNWFTGRKFIPLRCNSLLFLILFHFIHLIFRFAVKMKVNESFCSLRSFFVQFFVVFFFIIRREQWDQVKHIHKIASCYTHMMAVAALDLVNKIKRTQNLDTFTLMIFKQNANIIKAVIVYLYS